jgi:hypothetical protein
MIFCNTTQTSPRIDFSQWSLDNFDGSHLKQQVRDPIDFLAKNGEKYVPTILCASASSYNYTFSVYPKLAKVPIKLSHDAHPMLDIEILKSYF